MVLSIVLILYKFPSRNCFRVLVQISIRLQTAHLSNADDHFLWTHSFSLAECTHVTTGKGFQLFLLGNFCVMKQLITSSVHRKVPFYSCFLPANLMDDSRKNLILASTFKPAIPINVSSVHRDVAISKESVLQLFPQCLCLVQAKYV